MGTTWVVVLAISIFILFTFLYYQLTRGYAKKEYGLKIWKHWPSQLYYWQGAILYSVGFTAITMFLLKWINVLTF